MADTIEKIDGDGCLIEEATFAALVDRLCKLEANQVNAVTKPVYEYRELWAEESGGATANSSEWSFGNGATGFLGLPIDAGWEIVQMGFHADTYPSTATIQVDAMDYSGPAPGDAAARTLSSISLEDARDGGGDTNNAYKIVEISPAASVPAGVLGFITRAMVGAISDVRVYVRLRRQVGVCVESIIAGDVAGPGTVLGAPANGALVSDNFQDGNGNAPFNLQVRLNGAGPTNWQAVVTGPYATIPNLVAGAYTLATNDNGDGTYTHVFTGTTPLSNFGGITITGDAPTPAGQGGTANVDLYIP